MKKSKITSQSHVNALRLPLDSRVRLQFRVRQVAASKFRSKQTWCEAVLPWLFHIGFPKMGVHPNHPFLDGIFHEITHPSHHLGVPPGCVFPYFSKGISHEIPMTVETPASRPLDSVGTAKRKDSARPSVTSLRKTDLPAEAKRCDSLQSLLYTVLHIYIHI